MLLVIFALIQVKFNQRLKLADEIAEESDEEINQLKRIIRIRRQQKQKEKCFTAFDSSFVENIGSSLFADLIICTRICLFLTELFISLLRY